MFSEVFLIGSIGITTCALLLCRYYSLLVKEQSRHILALEEIEWYATALVDSTANAVHILHGDGFRRYVKIRSRCNPKVTAIVEVGDINPNTMELLGS